MRYLIQVLLFFPPSFLFAQSNLQLLGHLPYDSTTLAGCLHFVDSTGSEYALVGTSRGFSIVDLDDPSQPVQRFKVPGLPNNWREMCTWNGFAYVGSEAVGSGITIVDLRSLPDTIYWTNWYGDGDYAGQVQRSHTVKAADGYLYIFGGGNVTNGATIASLSNPWNPHIVGKYTANYVHDGLIRGDTLWTSEIIQGQFGVVDISDKTNPVLLTTHPTPFAFNHNTGLSDDGKILFTTDEKPDAPLAAFDVSDLDNITLLDNYYPSQNPSREVHNVRVFGHFLVNPSYGGQLTIVDATRPDNLIETAFASLGSSLVWDADPYLPSGILIASAKTEGLFVFQPTYQRAAYLEGQITDASNAQPLTNAKVVIVNSPKVDSSGFGGFYKTGSALPGNYTVEISKTGYLSQSFFNVSLQTGLVTVLNAQLIPESTGNEQIGKQTTFSVYPTLFQDVLYVTVPGANPFTASGTVIQILDLKGRIVQETPFTGSTPAISVRIDLPAAAYTVRIGDGRRWSGGVIVWKR